MGVMWDVMEDRSDGVVDDNEEDQLKYVNVASKILLFQQRIRRYSEIKEEVSTERKQHNLYSRRKFPNQFQAFVKRYHLWMNQRQIVKF